jgi:putative transcriptional regulator
MKNRLRFLRAERNWSQADLAAHLAVSRQTVNSIETGKHGPSLVLAFNIARLFRRPIEAIFLPKSGSRWRGLESEDGIREQLSQLAMLDVLKNARQRKTRS